MDLNVIFISLLVIAILLTINIYLSAKAGKKVESAELIEIKSSIGSVFQSIQNFERNLKEEFSTNRKENADSLKSIREEVGSQLNTFTKTFSENLSALTKSNEEKLEAIRKSIEEKLSAFQVSIETASKENRKELKENLDGFKKELNEALKDFKNNIRDNFSDFNKQQQTQSVANTEKLAELKKTLESSIKNLQEGNEKKLEEMRNTVDEKLQKTLETRLTQSFEIVSKNLESVQKGLGEMQQLATGVGDLKKVLSNVKSRGILGEIQLGAILEQVLAPSQYKTNVQIRQGSRENVEFVVCLPGRDDDGKECFLPIDAKFPMEDYYALVTAYETADVSAVEIAKKGVETIIKKCAKDIRDKYIDPPTTTDFGIMFLPFEGLYAEVVRNTSLIETLQ
ncbi:MAG: DNA recombination protein RmuC, partial [Alphaproteobacteria bacterium]|nr:DNA recombination protein RmuC [Alphaproteobacteria bacterium]